MTFGDAIARSAVLERTTDLLSVVVDRAKQACFVDLIVGVLLFGYYAVLIWYRLPVDLWPLVAAFGISRGGDALKGMAQAVAEGIKHAR